MFSVAVREPEDSLLPQTLTQLAYEATVHIHLRNVVVFEMLSSCTSFMYGTLPY